MRYSRQNSHQSAFSLVEVVLAIGVLSLAVVALLGLFGPTLGSVKQVIDTSEATGAVSRINTYIQREMSWAQVESAISGGGTVFYVWKRQENLNAPVEMAVAREGGAGFTTAGGATVTILDDLDAGRLVGSPVAVALERGMPDSDYWSGAIPIAEQGYNQVFISIFPIRPGQTFATPAELRTQIQPVFSYTTAKLRSM